MKYLAIAVIFGTAAQCLAAQSSLPLGEVCGKVVRTDTGQPINGALVVARSYAGTRPFPSQRTTGDGSFCFRSLSQGQYGFFAVKSGLVPLPLDAGMNAQKSVMVEPGKPSPVFRIRMTPALPVFSVEDALDSKFTPKQRQEMVFEMATFSPDGRYLAVSAQLNGKDSSYGSQVFRYDFETRALQAVTPEPTLHTLPSVGEIAWSGDVLYSAVTYTSEVGKDVFYKTDGETTSAIDSFPPRLKRMTQRNPVHVPVGPYVVDGELVHGGGMQLSIGKTPITNVAEDFWTTLDNPPTVFYGGYWLHVFYLGSRQKKIVVVPNGYGTEVLAVKKLDNGFRIAYAVGAECGVNREILPPDFTIPEKLPESLCFVDVPDASPPNPSGKISAIR